MTRRIERAWLMCSQTQRACTPGFASQTGATDSIRLQQWAASRDLCQRNYDILTELDREGRLAAADRQVPRQLARELAGCSNSLAKLKRSD